MNRALHETISFTYWKMEMKQSREADASFKAKLAKSRGNKKRKR